MIPKNIGSDQSVQKPLSQLKGWAALLGCVVFLWAFMFYIGPWIENSVPAVKQFTDAARERDIDTTAFFYSENKESYEAERYLMATMDSAHPKGSGFNLVFISGIVCCFSILAIGFYFMSGGRSKDGSE